MTTNRWKIQFLYNDIPLFPSDFVHISEEPCLKNDKIEVFDNNQKFYINGRKSWNDINIIYSSWGDYDVGAYLLKNIDELQYAHNCTAELTLYDFGIIEWYLEGITFIGVQIDQEYGGPTKLILTIRYISGERTII